MNKTNKEIPVENLRASDPGYDEAFGPFNPHAIDRFVPIEEVTAEDTPLRFVAGIAEDPQELMDRLLHQDPSEPLGLGETRESVIKDLGPLIIVDDEYEPNCGPARIAVRNFGVEEFTPVSPGMVAVTARKFDKSIGRFRSVQYVVPVTVTLKQ